MTSIAIKSQHILQAEGSEIDGTLIITDGKIEAITTTTPKNNVETIDAKNLYVSPGLIDAHTHLGMYEEASAWAGEDGNEMVDPITPHVRAIDSINPEDKAFREARQAGVTSVMITPGSGNVMGDQICVVKNVGKTLEEMLVSPHVGIKMAMGENPKRVYGKQGKAPMTRRGVAAMLRDTFTKARHYLELMCCWIYECCWCCCFYDLYFF